MLHGDKPTKRFGDIDAVVILGAGLDTRAYRLTRRVRMPVSEVAGRNIARQGQDGPLVNCRCRFAGCIDFEHDDLLTALAEHGYRTEYRVFLSAKV